jgi:hypothetical protein
MDIHIVSPWIQLHHTDEIIVSNRLATTRRNIFCNMTSCVIHFNLDFTSSGTDLTTLSTFPLQQTGPERLIATNQLIHFRGQYSHQQLETKKCMCYVYKQRKTSHRSSQQAVLHTAFLHKPREAHQGKGDYG